MDNGIKSFQHQVDVYERSKDEKAWALFLETGTGKTKIAIDTAIHLFRNGQIEAVIVIGPKAVYKKVWIEQLIKFKPDDLTFDVMWWEATRTYNTDEKLKNFVNRMYKTNKLTFFLINVETFAYKPIEEYIRAFLRNYKCAMIIDESTRIKNPNAKRTKKILEYSLLVQYKRVMSGFPVLNSPTDLYTQITFLGRKLIPFASYYSFRNFYSILRQLDRRVTIEIGYKNLDHLSTLLEGFSSRVLKKDCLDLPPKLYERQYVDMTVEQAIAYRTMRDRAMADLDGERVTAVNIMTQVGKLHQIANGILLGGDASHQLETEKDKALLELLNNEVNGPVVIAASYTKNIEHLLLIIRTKFGVRNCEAIHGSVSDSDRDKHITAFQSGTLRFLIINPATVREGIDLFASHTCIFYNNNFKLDFRLQFEDRFHRIGQTNKVTYIDLITEKTMEEHLLEVLQKKRNIGGTIFLEAEWKEWFN